MLELLTVALPWFYLGLAIQFVMRLSRSRGVPRAVIVRAVTMASASGLLVYAILGISRFSDNVRVGVLGLALLLAGLALKTLKDAKTGKVLLPK